MEAEIARLKKLLTEAELDKAILKELAEGGWRGVQGLMHRFDVLPRYRGHCRPHTIPSLAGPDADADPRTSVNVRSRTLELQ